MAGAGSLSCGVFAVGRSANVLGGEGGVRGQTKYLAYRGRTKYVTRTILGGGVKACVTTKCFAERNNVTILGGGQALRNNRTFFFT